MDALTHTIEGYTTLGAWELTDALHLKAIKIIATSLPGSARGDDSLGVRQPRAGSDRGKRLGEAIAVCARSTAIGHASPGRDGEHPQRGHADVEVSLLLED